MSIYDFTGNFRIATRIWAGFLVVLALLVSVAGAGYWGVGSVGSHTDELMDSADESIAILEVGRDVQALRRNAERQILLGHAESGDVVTALRQRIDTRLGDYLKRSSLREDERAEIKELRESLAAYEARLDTALALRKQLGVANVGPAPALDESVARSLDDLGEEIGKRLDIYVAHNKDELLQVMADADAYEKHTKTLVLAMAAVAVLLGFALAFGTNFSISNPVRAITDVMNRLRNGDRKIDVPFTTLHDEVGEMAGAVEVFKENLIQVEKLRSEQERQKRQAEIEKKKAIDELANDFEQAVMGIVGSVSSSSSQLHASAQSLSALAEQVRHQAASVSSASREASTNVETVAAATEELSASIGEITARVEDSAQVSANAVDEAARVNIMVEGLAGAVARIDEVVSLITDIASQTNLLALNATIEAARAGDAGKGFAVVANEVKNLANQTARATDEISAQIAAVQGATQEAVSGIRGISGTIAKISEISAAIATAVEEQGAATSEISRSVSQAYEGTKQVSVNINGVTQASTEAGAASHQVLDAARNLATQSERLKDGVHGFIKHLRAG